jgi:hypothetical protein
MYLKQQQFFKGTREFEFVGDDAVSVRIYERGAINEYIVKTATLDSHPNHLKGQSRSLPAYVLFEVFMILVGLGASQQPGINWWMGRLFLFVLFVVVPTLIFLPKILREAYDITVFNNRFNGAIALAFYHNKPNLDEFKKFTDELVKRIHKTALEIPAQGEISIAKQIEEFAKLRDNKVIGEEEFQKIKEKLLAKIENDRKIGF